MRVVNAFSVDLEDWYQAVTSINPQREKWHSFESRVERNTLRLLALMDEYKVRGTFFVLGHVAKDYPDLIRAIDAAGHEIGVHGFWHEMIHRMTPERFARELDLALETITPLVSQPLIGHRAPYFSINQRSLWALDVLQAKGFRYDSSFFPTRNPLYGYPGAPRFPHCLNGTGFVEFPMSTARWMDMNVPVAGGFYLRLYPYLLTRKGIQQVNRQGQAAVLYMHPWEIDTGHRYNRVKPREWIVQYVGRGGMENKLRRLFSDFAFAPIRDVIEDLRISAG